MSLCVQVSARKSYEGEKPSVSNFVLVNNLCVSSESVSLLNCITCSESIFTAKFWCLRRISVRCRIMSFAANLLLLLNCVVCSESSFAAELCGLH